MILVHLTQWDGILSSHDFCNFSVILYKNRYTILFLVYKLINLGLTYLSIYSIITSNSKDRYIHYIRFFNVFCKHKGLLIMKENIKSKKIKGFTLVELVVVIAIVGVLAAMIVPNMIAYIRKAKCTAAIASAKTIVTGAQSAIVDNAILGNLYLDKKAVIDGESVLVGGLTNTAVCNAYNDNASTNGTDRAIARSIAEILANAGIDPGNAATVKPFGQSCSSFQNSTNSNYGLVIIYTADGTVPFAQVYTNGILVTYAYGKYVANDKSTAKFINKGQSFLLPFTDAGENSADLGDDIKNSKFPSTW